jgi:hypothetical protein
MATIPYWGSKPHLLAVPLCSAVGTPAWHPGSTPASALRLGAAAEGWGGEGGALRPAQGGEGRLGRALWPGQGPSPRG